MAIEDKIISANESEAVLVEIECQYEGVGTVTSNAYMQAWKLLDGDETGKLPVSFLGHIFRAFGKNPSEKEVETIIVGQALDKVQGSVTFEEVLPLFIEVKDSSIDVETLRKSFKMFDEEGSGTISVDNLREALCKLGEPMTTDEVDYLIQFVEVKDHKIRYDDLIKILLIKILLSI